jgi:flagellar motor switch protein FliN/FliY
MAGDEQIGQDEIENLLRQGQSGDAAAQLPSHAAAATGSLGQDEIEALLENAGNPAAGSAASSKHAPAASRRDDPRKRVGGDDIELLLTQAEQAIASVDDPVAAELKGLAAFELKDFGGTPASADKATLELLRDVELDLKIELGRTHMYLEDVLKLRKGSVVTLDKLAGDPVDIYVNGRLIAQGEVLVLNDNFCVRVAELISGDDAV